MTAERVLLWRHGRTAYNHQSRFQGQLDIGLDAVGVEQVSRAGRLLAGQLTAFGHPSSGPVRLVTSDLARAASTAAALGGLLGVEPAVDSRLREIYAGSWQGLTTDEIREQWPGDYAAWRRGDDDVRIGGGETRSEAAARGAACVEELAASMDGGTLVCVSHGGTLRGALFWLLGWSDVPGHSLEGLRNAHWSQLQRMSFGWRLAAHNLGGVLEELETSPETSGFGDDDRAEVR